MQFHKDGTLPPDGSWIFVFGSNLAGIHGAGAAKVAAQKFGAKYGVGRGITGNAYGIATKDEDFNTLTLEEIDAHIATFAYFVLEGYRKEPFWMTRIGCGLAGYKDEEIAPLFTEWFKADDPVSWPEEWRQYLDF